MIKVTCQVDSYDDPVKPSIRVHNHWNRNEMVILEVEDKKVTVLVKDIIAAIRNCANTASF